METIIIGIVSLIISYFIIKGAIESALDKKLAKHTSVQTAYLKFLAMNAGMTNDQNNKIVLSDKEYKKLNKETTIKF